MSDVINVIAIILFLLCWFLVIKKLFAGRYASVKTVKATMCDKYKSSVASKYPGIFNRQHYIVVFETNDKKLSFKVSEFSYNSYKMNKKGMLKYKGNQIISFK